MNHTQHALLTIVAAGLCGLIPQAGQAQTTDTKPPSNTTPPSSIFGEKTEVYLGLGAAWAPRYLGADESRLLPVPTLGVYRGIFFADSVRGIGVEYLAGNGFYASVSAGYDFGRTDKNSRWRPGSKKLAGMGEVKGSTTATLTLAQELTTWLAVNGEAEFRIAGFERGNRYRLGIESTLLRGNRNKVTLGVNAHAGDVRYNRTYFGVNPIQAQASRFARFEPRSGMYAYSLSAYWEHDFDPHWTLSLGVNAMRFSERARHSPVVERRNGISSFASLHYGF